MDVIDKTIEKVVSYDTNGDFQQVFAVMKNELVKFLRGKKIYIYLAIIGLLMALMIALPLMVGEKASILDDGDKFAESVLGNLTFVLMIMATLFTAGAICSEYEERTALILLTKPIKRSTIVAGKYLASFIVGIATLLLHLIVALFFMAIGKGHITGELFAGMGVYLAYILAITGVAMLVSAFAKKSSTSTLLTLFTLFILPLILETILANRGMDTWYLLGSLGEAASYVMVGGGEPLRDTIAMVVWAILTVSGAIVLFNRRQF